MKKIFCLSITLLILICGQVFAQESIIESIQKEKVLRVGMSTFVPWAMKDKQGELIGFEIDVAKQLAKDMGVEIEFVSTAWSGIIPALLTGKFDLIIGGMGITPERNLKVNFTIPYEYSGMSLVANKAKAKGFSSIDDFNKKGVVIAARLGTTAEQAAIKYMPNATLKLFENESQALQDLHLGRIAAYVSSAPMPAFHALKFPKKLFVPIKENFTKEPIGFALKKGDHDALNFLNNWILNMRANGFLDERKAYWFESKDWETLVK